jgi:MFS family permease
MKILRLNFAVTVIGFLDTHLLIPVIALYATTLGAGVGVVGVIVGLYSITNTLANLIGGRLVDKFGYKAPLIGGLLGDSLAMFAYSLCRLPWHLALVRAFHGGSGGLVGPATMSVVAKQASTKRRGKSMASYGMAIATATLLGYGGGGIIASRLGNQFVFYTGGLLLVFAVIVAGLMPKGAGVNGDRTSWKDSAKKIVELLKNENLRLPYWAIFAQYFAFGGIVALLPLHVATSGMTAFHVGMLLAMFSLMFVLVQMPGGYLSDKIGRLKPTTVGLGLAVAGVVTIPLVGTFGLMVVIMALYGTGFGLLFPSISATIADSTMSEEYGRATGIFHALITAGVSIGAPLMGCVADFLGIKLSLSLSSIALVIALVMAARALSSDGKSAR